MFRNKYTAMFASDDGCFLLWINTTVNRNIPNLIINIDTRVPHVDINS